MSQSPTTSPSLLVRIRDPQDGLAWNQFVEIYAPLVYGFARKHGLQDADAADLTQDVLQKAASSAGKLDYEPARGSFRGWLFTVVRNRLRDFLDRQPRTCRGSGKTSVHERLDQLPTPAAGLEEQWEQEYEQTVLQWAAEQVREDVTPTTWQAFWLTTVEAQSGQQVASTLGLSVAAVYLAKSRVMARLKDCVRQLHDD